MRLLFISNLYEPYARGGAEIIVKRTIEAYVRQGHEVFLLTAQPFAGISPLRPHRESKDGYTIIRYYPLNLFFYANDGKYPFWYRSLWHAFDLYNLHTRSVVARLLKELSPDVVVTHNLMGLGYSVVPAIRRSGVKHVHVLHDIQLAVRSGLLLAGQEHGLARDGFLAHVYQGVTRRLFGSPSVVISPSQFLLDFYKQRGFFAQSRLEVLRNPIDSRFFEGKRVSKPNQSLHVATIGQLTAAKGLESLYKALQALQESGKSFVWHIVGAGPMQAQVEAWAKESPWVQFHGRIKNEELPSFLGGIDVVAVPTLTYENSPTIVFEALAAGCPVLVSDIGGAAEAIVAGKNGWTMRPGDQGSMIAALQQLCAPQDWSNLSAQARQSVSGLDTEAYVARLTTLIRSKNGR